MAALTDLTRRVASPEVRSQLGALGALLANLDSQTAPDAARYELEVAIATAIDGNDEAAAVAAMRSLAALDRAVLTPVDWAAVSRG